MRCFSISDWGKSIKHHWGILVLSFLLICVVGIPAIWLLIQPQYTVTGAIRVAPFLKNIVTGETKGMSNYQSFMATEVELITSDRILQRVADDLTDKELSFFIDRRANPASKSELKPVGTKVSLLKQAISGGVIAAAIAPGTELLKVTMKSTKPEEAKQIVDAFIRAYMAVEASSSIQDQDRKLRFLDNERKVLAEKLKSHRDKIRQSAQEYGTATLVSRQDIIMQRVTMLLSELTRVQARRISLETQVQLLEQFPQQGIEPEGLLIKRKEYINSDPTVLELIRNIVQLERDLIIAKQTLTAEDPVLQQKQELIDTFQSHLDEKRQKVAVEFDTMISKETANASKQKLRAAKVELARYKAHETRLQLLLADEDTQTVKVGRTQLDIADFQFQFELDKGMYETVLRRIQVLEMERKRPARVSVAYYADIGHVRDNRVKYTTALIIGAMACGMLLAFLREKAQ